jgi:hypothetical protein
MMPKDRQRIPALQRRILLLFLRKLVLTRRGNVKILPHRVPLPRELWLVKPLFKKKMMNFSTSWHHKLSSSSEVFAVLAFFLLSCKKPIFFVDFSDDEEPKRDTATPPSTEYVVVEEPSVQETEPAVKSPKATRACVKKVPMTRSTKRSKKSKEVDISLEAHDSADSSDDVSKCP